MGSHGSGVRHVSWSFAGGGSGFSPRCGACRAAALWRARPPGHRRVDVTVAGPAGDRLVGPERLFPASNAVDGNTGTRWSSAFSDPQWLQVDLGSSASITQVVLQWEAAYATAFQIQTSTDGTNWTTIYSTTTGTGGTQTLNVTGTGRYIRMYGTARATHTATRCGSSRSTAPWRGGTCGTTDAALNQPATASSTENASFPASAAVDGNTGTRWSSAFSDPQWLQVDLGSTQTICQVSLNWEPPTPKRSRSRPRPTARTGPRSTPPPPAPAASRPSTSRVPAGISACTARREPPSTATPCGSSTSTPPAAAVG